MYRNRENGISVLKEIIVFQNMCLESRSNG